MITAKQLSSLTGGNTAIAEAWAGPLNAAMAEFGIDQSETRIAYFLANCAHESAGFTQLEEDLNYSSGGHIRDVFGKNHLIKNMTVAEVDALAHSPQALANTVYGYRGGNGAPDSGDGWRFRARSPIGLTFKDNYNNYGRRLKLDLVANPEVLLTPEVGARAAACFFHDANCNAAADAGDFDACCDQINIGHHTPLVGDAIGFKGRAARLKQWLEARSDNAEGGEGDAGGGGEGEEQRPAAKRGQKGGK